MFVSVILNLNITRICSEKNLQIMSTLPWQCACAWFFGSAEFLATKLIKKNRQTYSLDKAILNFSVIRTQKIILKGQRTAGIPGLQQHVTILLKGIPENEFQEYLQQLIHEVWNFTKRVLWEKPIVTKEDHFVFTGSCQVLHFCTTKPHIYF